MAGQVLKSVRRKQAEQAGQPGSVAPVPVPAKKARAKAAAVPKAANGAAVHPRPGTNKANATPPPAGPVLVDEPEMGPWPTPPRTLEESLRRIEAMGERISGYIRFICKVGTLAGTSAEAKEKAVSAFYDRMVVLERQLGRVHDDLWLG
jgi:hypothetical protein